MSSNSDDHFTQLVGILFWKAYFVIEHIFYLWDGSREEKIYKLQFLQVETNLLSIHWLFDLVHQDLLFSCFVFPFSPVYLHDAIWLRQISVKLLIKIKYGTKFFCYKGLK